ncbi:MAG: hypothetical protein J6G98_02065 [Bacilli bacterium]|nr:hypothetical protein [Bacilli bacterium]
MKDMLRNKVETQLAKLESQVNSGLEISEEDISTTRNILNNAFSMKSAEYTEEEKKAIESRFASLTKEDIMTIKAEGNVTERSISVKAPIITKIRRNKAKAISATLVAALGITLVACSVKDTKVVEKPVEKVEVEAPVEEEKVVEEKTTMDSEYQEFAESISNGFNNELETGMPDGYYVDETNLEQYAQSYTFNYISKSFNNYSDEQLANMFPDSKYVGKDLVDAKYAWEWIDQQRVVVSNNYLDYDLVYNESDAKLIEDGAQILDEYKNADSKSKKTIANNFIDYTRKNILSDDANILYTPAGMDTFRAVYFEAFDELSNHKVIDDELEHAVNTTIACSVSGSNLDVEDKTIKGIQSEFQTYLAEKYDTRLQVAWNYAAVNKDDINQYNNVEYIVDYVVEHADLTKEVQLGNYEETLTNMFITNSPGKVISKDDSGVSNGKKEEVLSKSQLEQYGISPSDPQAKEKLEEAVNAEEDKKAEESKVLSIGSGLDTNPNAQTITKTVEEANDAWERGSLDAQNGLDPQSNDPDYMTGYNWGKDYITVLKNNLKSNQTTTYETVDNGEETVTDETQVITEYYTNDSVSDNYVVDNTVTDNYVPYVEENKTVTNSNQGTTFEPITEFVPAEEQTVTESEITTYDYTEPAFEPAEEETVVETEITETDYTSSINELKALREQLSASIDSQYTSGRSI